MAIWRIKIRDEEYSGAGFEQLGLAKTAKEAIDKALGNVRKDNPGYKHLYVVSLECLGNRDF